MSVAISGLMTPFSSGYLVIMLRKEISKDEEKFLLNTDNSSSCFTYTAVMALTAKTSHLTPG